MQTVCLNAYEITREPGIMEILINGNLAQILILASDTIASDMQI